jgi:hypothetical protein
MEATIESRAIWVPTGLRVVAGRNYRLSAAGRWKDAGIDTDAAGYPSANLPQRWTERWRRQPDAPWFALVGAIDRRRETQFVIGSGCAWRATASGELTCFANDLRWFYFNNSGRVVLRVEPDGPP